MTENDEPLWLPISIEVIKMLDNPEGYKTFKEYVHSNMKSAEFCAKQLMTKKSKTRTEAMIICYLQRIYVALLSQAYSVVGLHKSSLRLETSSKYLFYITIVLAFLTAILTIRTFI